MESNQVAKDVRVKLNSKWKAECLGDEYLQVEPIIFIAEGHIYNDSIGEYVFVKGGSMTNSGTAYLNQLDLEFTIGEIPLYSWETLKK